MTETEQYATPPRVTQYSPEEVAAAGFHGPDNPALQGTGDPSLDSARTSTVTVPAPAQTAPAPTEPTEPDPTPLEPITEPVAPPVV